MPLNASVACNCYEAGKITNPPPFPHTIEIDEWGFPDITLLNRDDESAYMDWDEDNNACEHERFNLVDHLLGNITTVSLIRRSLEKVSKPVGVPLPIILERVVYSGAHCDDKIECEEMQTLKAELNSLTPELLSVLDADNRQRVDRFIVQMTELVAASESVGKPIVF